MLCMSLVSCEHSRLAFSGDPATEYHKTLRSLTQYQRLFGLDKALYETYVTYINTDLSQKYVDEYVRVFSVQEDQKNIMTKEALDDQQKYDDFMVAHFASDMDNQNLNKNSHDTMVWKFFLQSADGTMVEANSITPIKLGTQRSYFYPHLNGWNRLYRIRFPKNSSNEKKFIMKGTVRELTFTWK